jgi:hypothetical protein
MTAVLMGLLALAAAAAAQTTAPMGAVFEGQIIDSISGEPIEGVLVRMDSGAEAFSDARGDFSFTGLPQGRRLFALLSSDCRITWGEIVVVVGIPRRERLRLPPAFGAAAEEAEREEAQRRRTGGKRVEADEIARMHVRSVTELIRRVAPNMVGSVNGDPGATAAIRSGRSRSFVPDDPPVVVVDGVRLPNAASVLHDLQASEVQVLEVMPGAAAGWEYGSAGAAGVIKITLKTGLAEGAPERRSAAPCVVLAFPRS